MPEHIFMRRCLDLASLGGKKVRPNPHVGAVLVHENRIIGEGWHQEYGGPHAEVNCLNSVRKKDRNLIQKATLYVSLEPCSFQGKTPACTHLIIDNKIPRVVVSAKDPNPRVNGQGLNNLREKGIEVIAGFMEKEGKEMIRDFRVNLLEKRPYILLKIVKSRHHFMGRKGEKIWLSNPWTTRLSHRWRAEIDGIMVGTETVLNDDPSLDTRLYPGESPVRILFDRQQRIPAEAKAFQGSSKSIILSTNDGALSGNNIEYEVIDFKEDDHLLKTVHRLYEKGIYTLMVEGGSKLLHSFIKVGLWDEARVIQSKHPLDSGVKAPNICGELIEKRTFQDNTYYRIFRN
jgi:diaminohydroxyphosphoribosylaminopyrimidine deaminase/5-amino-6-(5-phosphoribosylamino)uracil reductase